MNAFVACILCLFLNYASSEDVPISNNMLLLDTADSTCGREGLLGCSEDLKGQIFCLFGREIIIDCQTQTGRPDCDPITFECFEKPDPPCICEDKPEEYPFHCPRTGFFPHPMDCSKLLICSPANTTIVSDCDGLVYDPLNQICSSEVDCYTFSAVDGLCKGMEGSIVVHPLNRAVYAFCNEDEPLMSQCPEGHVFNANKLRCEIEKN